MTAPALSTDDRRALSLLRSRLAAKPGDTVYFCTLCHHAPRRDPRIPHERSPDWCEACDEALA